MLTIHGVLALMAEGKPLPQQAFPDITDQQIEDLQEAEPVLLNRILIAEDAGGDAVDAAMSGLREKAAEHGWYPVVAVLCMLFAHRYDETDIPATPALSRCTAGLLKMLSIANHSTARNCNAWTIPFAMLASLGEEAALEFTSCAALCAAVGFIRSTQEKRAQT